MTREETVLLIRSMTALYPTFKPADLTDTVNVWASMLQERDGRMIMAALKWYAESDKSGFAPSIGQLVDRYHRLTSGDELQAEEAWALVRRAISNSAYAAKTEFAHLPEAVQKAVGSADVLRTWGISELSDLGYIEAGFLKSYKAILARQREYATAGTDLKALLNSRQEALPEARRPRTESWQEAPDKDAAARIRAAEAAREKLKGITGGRE